jgi:hypothetical protein
VKCIWNFLSKPEGKTPVRMLSSRWKSNVKMNLKGIVYVHGNWIHLVQDRVQWRDLVNTIMKHSGCIKYREFLDQLSDYLLLNGDSAPWS